MQEGVFSLLGDAGIRVRLDARGYRPAVSLDGVQAKVLKPQNIVEMLHHGSRDIGFAGADWVAELGADLVDLVDTELDPVRLVAAAPVALLENGALPKRRLIVASEYENLAKRWIADNGVNAEFVRTYGATEVFPPEDADCIVDNTATGSTLRANGLEIIGELMRSSTRMYANPRALEDRSKRKTIDSLVLLMKAVLEARRRVMVEMNVSAELLEQLVAKLPCMREPTIATLHNGVGFAVKVASPRDQLATLVPEIKAAGGTDIVVTKLAQIVP
jgi:ATP phosphoribosyltransferase